MTKIQEMYHTWQNTSNKMWALVRRSSYITLPWRTVTHTWASGKSRKTRSTWRAVFTWNTTVTFGARSARQALWARRAIHPRQVYKTHDRSPESNEQYWNTCSVKSVETNITDIGLLLHSSVKPLLIKLDSLTYSSGFSCNIVL